MTQISDGQLKVLWEGLLTAKEYLLTAPLPDNRREPLMKGVNQALSIIRNANEDTGTAAGKPTGGSRGYYSYDPVEASKNLILMGGGECATAKKTKALFEMFHLK